MPLRGVLAQKLEGELERPVVVDSRPGAFARLAASLFKRLPADGTNLMLAIDALMMHAPHVFNKLAFDVFQDFTPVSEVSSFACVLATGSDPKPVRWARSANSCAGTPREPPAATPPQAARRTPSACSWARNSACR